MPAPEVRGTTVGFPANAPQLASLTIEPVGPQQPAYVHLPGRLAWDEDATVRVFTPFAGRVRELLAEVGQPVTNGQALAIIDSPDFGQAVADLRKAESALQLSERTLDRTRDLLAHGGAARKDLEQAEADHTSALSEKNRADTRLAVYGKVGQGVDTTFSLPTPLRGTVVEKNVTPGQEVRPDQMLANVSQFVAPLFVISDPRRLWVYLDVGEAHFALIRRGMELRILSPAFPGRSFRGRLEISGDALDPTTRTVKARGVVENAEGLLKAELYVTVEVPDVIPASIQVPAKAVFHSGSQDYVFLESAPGQFQRTAVKRGTEREGRVAILEGLQTGQRLVTEGCLLLQASLEDAPKE